MIDHVLAIDGLRCDHCVQTVTTALSSVHGVAKCKVDLQSSLAKVQYDPTLTTLEQLVQAVRKAGFDVASKASPTAPLVTLSAIGPGSPSTDHGQTAPPHVADRDGNSPVRWLLDVDGMHCASCSARVEDALARLDGVIYGRANLATNQAAVVTSPDGPTLNDLVSVVRAAGYDAKQAASAENAAQEMRQREQALVLGWRRRLVLATAFLIPLLLVARFWHSEPAWLSGVAQWLLATPIQLYVGWPYLVGAWRRLRQRSTNMNTLPWRKRSNWSAVLKSRKPMCSAMRTEWSLGLSPPFC